jgi:hypothetical protein
VSTSIKLVLAGITYKLFWAAWRISLAPWSWLSWLSLSKYRASKSAGTLGLLLVSEAVRYNRFLGLTKFYNNKDYYFSILSFFTITTYLIIIFACF